MRERGLEREGRGKGFGHGKLTYSGGRMPATIYTLVYEYLEVGAAKFI